MKTPHIKMASQSDAEPCVAVIVLGFSGDPGVRWMYPDPHQYLEYFPRFVSAFGGNAFEQGTAFYVENFPAAALWLPPGIQPDEEVLVALIEESVAESEQEAVFALFGQLEQHHPSEPHWHLPLVATDPMWQGRGYGAALLRHTLALCDQQQTLAYLEATSERSIPLYQRHGFEVVGNIQVGTSPPITPMLRPPK